MVRPLAVLALVLGSVAVLPPPGSVEASPGSPGSPGSAAKFQEVSPARLADTRSADCTCTWIDDATIRVQVTGRDSVPADAVAAALTITATNTARPGFATVWPSGTPRRETSTLNWSAGENRANGTIVELGSNGAIDVYVDGAADVIVDVTGVFVEVGAGATSTAGRFQPLAPARLLDTRSLGAPTAAGSTIDVPLPPTVAADAVAVAVNVTATGSTAGGYVTAFAAGAAPPETSTVNTDGPGQTRAASAIVPVTRAGLSLFTSDTAHLIVDVVGWFTGATGDESSDGLFRAVAPLRIFDTRASAPVNAGGTIEMYADDPAARDAVETYRREASALVFNTTVTGSVDDGFVTAYPARTNAPETSSINWLGGESVANLTISPVSSAGVAFAASASTDVIVDVTGFFTGTALPVTGPPPANPAPVSPTPAPRDALQDPIVAAIVRSAVPSNVWAVLGDVDMGFLPDSTGACSGVLGVAVSSFMGIGDQVMLFAQELVLAEALHTACPATMVPRSVAAHEVGHILIARWVAAPGTFAGYQQRREIVDALSPGREECLAESVGQLLFELAGLTGYVTGYNNAFQSCAVADRTRSLAQQVVTSTTGA